MRAGRMVVVSGPSGSGKSTICRRLREDPRVAFGVSATTRPRRKGEEDGREYHFVSPTEFRDMLERGEFIEHAEVYGNMYGSLRAPMRAAIEEGKIFLLEIDVQGANQLRAMHEPGTYVFIAPPGFEELRRRLLLRGTEAPEVIERRLHKAQDEWRERVKYDHVVINDDLETTLAEVRRIIGLPGPVEG